jgi:hypothetical protein
MPPDGRFNSIDLRDIQTQSNNHASPCCFHNRPQFKARFVGAGLRRAFCVPDALAGPARHANTTNRESAPVERPRSHAARRDYTYN